MLSGDPAAISEQVLACPMQDNDADAATIRDYLISLVAEVWSEGEGFSGKRPFGDSGWEYEIYVALLKAGMVDGELDEDGYVEEVDEPAANKLIADAIESLRAT